MILSPVFERGNFNFMCYPHMQDKIRTEKRGNVMQSTEMCC